MNKDEIEIIAMVCKLKYDYEKSEEENKQLKEKYNQLKETHYQLLDDEELLQMKIDKAIDKLKHTIHFIGKDKNGVENEWVYLIDIEKEILEILSGDSNDR